MTELKGVNFMVSYQYREGNNAVDFLAKEGKMGKNVCYENQHLVPSLLKGILQIDRLGLPNIRL